LEQHPIQNKTTLCTKRPLEVAESSAAAPSSPSRVKNAKNNTSANCHENYHPNSPSPKKRRQRTVNASASFRHTTRNNNDIEQDEDKEVQQQQNNHSDTNDTITPPPDGYNSWDEWNEHINYYIDSVLNHASPS